MKSKLQNFYLSLSTCSFDLICLSETWLDNNVNNSEFTTQNYIIFRKDRNFVETKCSRGGGVLIAVRNNFSVQPIDLTSFNCISIIDIVGVKITQSIQTLYVFVM